MSQHVLDQSAPKGAGTPGEAMIPTARGDAIPASRMGFTHSAELVIQETAELAENWPDNSWGARPEAERIADVVEILNNAYAGGVETIVDRTIVGIKRDVARMKKIALQTKMNILVCTGYYTLDSLPYYFRYLKDMPERFPNRMKLEDFMARDVLVGIKDTGVCAAAIKVASDKYGIEETPDVRGVFTSCCRAHRKSGAPLTTHGLGIPTALKHLQIFADEGVDLGRVVLCHMDRSPASSPLEDFERALDKGSFISFDGWFAADETNTLASDSSPPELNLNRIVALVRKGYGKQIMLAGGWPIAFEDCFPSDFGQHDGVAPYMRVRQKVVPALKELGLSDAEIKQMTHTSAQLWASTLAKGAY